MCSNGEVKISWFRTARLLSYNQGELQPCQQGSDKGVCRGTVTFMLRTEEVRFEMNWHLTNSIRYTKWILGHKAMHNFK